MGSSCWSFMMCAVWMRHPGGGAYCRASQATRAPGRDVLVTGFRLAPCPELPVAMTPLGFGAASLQVGKCLVVRVVGGQVQAEGESCRTQQPKQRSQRGLPLVTLVSGDHGDGPSRTVGPFSL